MPSFCSKTALRPLSDCSQIDQRFSEEFTNITHRWTDTQTPRHTQSDFLSSCWSQKKLCFGHQCNYLTITINSKSVHSRFAAFLFSMSWSQSWDHGDHVPGLGEAHSGRLRHPPLIGVYWLMLQTRHNLNRERLSVRLSQANDNHLLHAADVILDLLDEAHLVQLIAAVFDVAQEHPCLADLDIFQCIIFHVMSHQQSVFLPEIASCPSTWTVQGKLSQRRWWTGSWGRASPPPSPGSSGLS